MRAVLLATALAALSLTACGSDSSDGDVRGADDPITSSSTPSTTPSADEELPACADVWVTGAVLPGSYAGCSDDTGDYTTHQGTYCESGQMVYAFGDHHYATPGGPVVETEMELADDPAYVRMVSGCTG